MKIKANRDHLLKPLLLAGNVVERRQTLPILANVLLSASTGQLRITATDLEVELSAVAEAEVSEDFEFTLPAKKLIDICKALPEGAEVAIELDGEKATLRSGRGRYSMGTLAARDYPAIEPSAASENFEIETSLLKRLIDKTSFAMAHQDVRYYLNGLLVEIRAGRIRAVATDGHRLALCESDVDLATQSDVQVILPRKAVSELGRLLNDSAGKARVEVSNSHLRVSLGEASFTTKLIDGRFPDYERVMPSGESTTMVANRDDLRQALARTSILSNEKYRGLRFRLSSGLLHLQAHNPEQDEAEEEVEVEFAGESVTIGFNVGYLLDALAVIETDDVHLAVVDANSSTLVTPASQQDCRYVIMPMRL